MPLFVVGYDLKEPRDYGPIEEALEALDSCHTRSPYGMWSGEALPATSSTTSSPR